jgi:hypothetical protein
MERSWVVLISLLAASGAIQPPAGEGKPGRVEGQVVDKDTKQGVAGARVVLLRWDRPDARWSGDIWDTPVSEAGVAPDSPKMAVAASDHGEFSFVVARPAEFRLFVSAPGYVRAGGAGMPLRIKADEETLRVTLELEREVAISGKVLDAETGKPVAGLAVTAWRYRRSGAGDIGGGRALVREGGEAVTGDDGGFRLAGLPPDRYFLKAAAPLAAKIGPPEPVEDFRLRQQRAYQELWYPGAADRREALSLTVGGSGIEGVEFRVSQRRVAAVRARVDAPARSAPVSVAVIRVEQGLAAGGFSVVARGEVTPGEVFEVSRLTPGRYLFSAVQPGTEPGVSLRGQLYQDIGEENVEGLAIPLSAGVQVQGTVRIAGRAPQPGEPALPAGGLRVVPRPEVSTAGSPKPAEVDSRSGTFALVGVIPDTYTLQLAGRVPGYRVSEVRYNGTLCPHGVFAIDPGAPAHKLEITLDAATASLSVQVSDGLRASPRAVVFVAREPVLLRLDPELLWPVEAGEGGEARVAGLLPGAYRVAAWRAGEPFLEDPEFGERIRNGVQVRLGAGEEARLQVRPHTVAGALP